MRTTVTEAARPAGRPRGRPAPRSDLQPVPAGRRRFRVPVAVIGIVAVLGVWELAVRVGQVPVFVVPPPSHVFGELGARPGMFASATLATLGEALGGLLLAAAAALGFAVAALHSRFLDRLLTPLVIVSQTIPVITLAPLLVLWFGYGDLPRVVLCALVAFFPMAVTSLEGFRSTDPDLLLLLRSVGASRWDVFWRVRLPNAGPFLAAGVRTGVTLCLVGAVVAEWTGSGRGLGYIVLSANSRLATAQAFGAVAVICLLGLLAYGGVGLLGEAHRLVEAYETRIGKERMVNLDRMRMKRTRLILSLMVGLLAGASVFVMGCGESPPTASSSASGRDFDRGSHHGRPGLGRPGDHPDRPDDGLGSLGARHPHRCGSGQGFLPARGADRPPDSAGGSYRRGEVRLDRGEPVRAVLRAGHAHGS